VFPGVIKRPQWAFPVWRVEVKATVTDAEDYALIDRYLERGIASAGLNSVGSLASFLGLDEVVVDRVLRFLSGKLRVGSSAEPTVRADRRDRERARERGAGLNARISGNTGPGVAKWTGVGRAHAPPAPRGRHDGASNRQCTRRALTRMLILVAVARTRRSHAWRYFRNRRVIPRRAHNRLDGASCRPDLTASRATRTIKPAGQT
jgi:hypothetical protein